MEKIAKKDFIEIKFTGYSQGQPFDSNIDEEIKKINPEAKGYPMVVIVGEGMVIPGFDKALEGKEIGKEYTIQVSAKEGFGMRDRNLIKIIPLKVFAEQKIYPQAGMVLSLDNSIAKIVAVSGGRVTTDFNNPLAGKDLEYKFTIVRKVTDDREKSEAVLKQMFGFLPEIEVKDKVYIKGPEVFKSFVDGAGKQFKELVGKELGFELKEIKKDEKDSKEEHSHDHSDHSHSDHDHTNHNHTGHDHSDHDHHDHKH